MATLAKLAQEVASSFDRGTDFIFIERIKELIINTRMMFIHREIDKYGVSERYIQGYVANLITVNASMDSTIDSKLTILRTENKIPAPIRYQTDVPFVFVGSLDRIVSFRYIKPYIMKHTRSLRLIGNGICYFYIDGYVYVYNNTKLERILIDAPYESLDVTRDPDSTGICYVDDMEFPLAGDMLNAVIAHVKELLRAGNDPNPLNPITTRDIN